jgi:hypothetical protein
VTKTLHPLVPGMASIDNGGLLEGNASCVPLPVISRPHPKCSTQGTLPWLPPCASIAIAFASKRLHALQILSHAKKGNTAMITSAKHPMVERQQQERLAASLGAGDQASRHGNPTLHTAACPGASWGRS